MKSSLILETHVPGNSFSHALSNLVLYLDAPEGDFSSLDLVFISEMGSIKQVDYLSVYNIQINIIINNNNSTFIS